MPSPSALIDAKIAKALPWQQATLKTARALANKAGCTEAIKWGMPAYVKGSSTVLITAAHKGWVNVILWDGALIEDKAKIFDRSRATERARVLKVLPGAKLPAAFGGYLRQAAKNAVAGKKVVLKRQPKGLPSLSKPFAALLDKAGVLEAFKKRAPYQQRGYLQWVDQAKSDVTRLKRQATMIHELKAGTYMPPVRER